MNLSEFDPSRPNYTVPHPLHELASAFLACRKTKTLKRAANKIQEYGGPLGHGIASYAFVDTLARTKTEDIDDKLRLYTAAESSAKQAINRSRPHDSTASAGIKAAMLLAELPLIKGIYVHGQYPDEQDMHDSYNAGIQVIERGRSIIRRSGDVAVTRDYTGARVTGALSELCIKLLVNRYAIRRMDSKHYVAVGSLFSQDNVRMHDKEATPWDINIFAAPGSDEFSTPTYKLQVKTAATETVCLDDVVYVSPRDLSTRTIQCNEHRLGAYLVGEAVWGNNDATTALDAWSDVLLDRIDTVM